MSDLVWGSVLAKAKTRATGAAALNPRDRRKALKVASTGVVYEPVARASGMMQPIEEEKVSATFLPTAELIAAHEELLAQQQRDVSADQVGERPESAT